MVRGPMMAEVTAGCATAKAMARWGIEIPTMSYTYDLGATWRHQIVLEQVLGDHPLPQPECLTGQGDNPIEYYDPDDPADPVPFDVTGAVCRDRHFPAPA
jgi:hypothetical protein